MPHVAKLTPVDMHLGQSADFYIYRLYYNNIKYS